MALHQMSLAVVGADHPNKKGPARRFELAICAPGEAVDLIPEPKNPVDPRAIAVFSCRGIQIGYVRAERAALVRSFMDRGRITGAIFQRSERWGATIRIGLDGRAPELPHDDGDSTSHDWPPPGSEDADWWPDDEPDHG